MTRDTDLLPCPFCGAEPPDLHLSHITGRIFCEGCGAEGPWSPAFNGDWNTRIPAAPAQEPPSPGVTAGATGPVSDADFLRDAGMDGAKWAAGFKAIAERLGHHGMDEGWLIGWFCNAIMAGYDEAERRYQNATPAPVVPAEGLADYDAGLLNDFGGGNVEWWQDYLRAEIGRANDFWRDQVSALRSAPPVVARVKPLAAVFDAAQAEAEKAMRKFPQPNYVISKVAEEAGEVVKAAIHCAENRETKEAVLGEVVQCMAMLIRLCLEGDQVHGLAALLPAGEGE